MSNRFLRVTATGAFDQMTEESRQRPVIIFKHSSTCPISAAAYEQMSAVDADVALVEVQRARELSREIESKTGVRHESPQVIILRNGQVVFNASHFQIKTASITQALNDANGQ